jgi:hypothetical protein
MYYFDRLHVNHFSQAALTRWLDKFALAITSRGSHQFAYRDGKYPAQYVFASANEAAEVPNLSATNLRQAFDSYRRTELERAKQLRDSIVSEAGARDLLVYGRGDNFFRARSVGGPLYRLPIRAVLDRNAGTLAPDSEFEILPPAAGLRENPDAVVLVAVSGSTSEVVATIRAESPGRTIIMV